MHPQAIPVAVPVPPEIPPPPQEAPPHLYQQQLQQQQVCNNNRVTTSRRTRSNNRVTTPSGYSRLTGVTIGGGGDITRNNHKVALEWLNVPHTITTGKPTAVLLQGPTEHKSTGFQLLCQIFCTYVTWMVFVGLSVLSEDVPWFS